MRSGNGPARLEQRRDPGERVTGEWRPTGQLVTRRDRPCRPAEPGSLARQGRCSPDQDPLEARFAKGRLELAGRQRALVQVTRLAATCDVVVDNFSARVMGNWGLDYTGLRALRPDLIAIEPSSSPGLGQRR